MSGLLPALGSGGAGGSGGLAGLLGTGTVQHFRVVYDAAPMQRRLEAQGWDAHVVSLLSRTR